ncbi:MAG: leucyl aminopeptidase [Acidobacteriaceae bacterium]|nr:leucyl aminopeptidase [Acidobacteriaceae bacterium]
MDAKLLATEPSEFATPLLAVFAVDISTDKDAKPLPVLLCASDAVSKSAERFLTGGEFKAGLCETLLLHAPAHLKADRLLIIGLGKAASLSPDQARKGAGAAVRFAKPRGLRDVAIIFPDYRGLGDEALDHLPLALTARALAEGAWIGDYDPDTYRTDRTDQSVRTVTVLSSESDKSTAAKIAQGFAEGNILGQAQLFTRTLVNEPGNVLFPLELARRAQEELEPLGVKVEVYSTDKLQELKMGSFWAVAKGSEQPPALIVMTYNPATPPADGSPVLGLVGKGITFDTGGISIKPADGMEKMKYDMAGAAAMIGAMRAIAQLKPANKVISVVCSAENMPDGKAYKPGDIVTAMSGKTIEIINTDAEGRLVLADGLHYAITRGATHLIDAATLTGACVVALGMLNAGVFSNDEDSYSRFEKGVKLTGEGFWRLPCTPEYRDLIKSSIADIMNTGGSRWGGAITAAMFLKEFVGDTPWIHLDIAGMAWMEENKPWIAKGPSGIAVRSIVEWVRNF